MKKNLFVILLIAVFICPAMTANTLAQPANPNEVCQDAWTKYQKADALWKTGWGLFGAGLGVGVTGGIMYPLGAFGNSSSPSGNPSANAVAVSGLTLLCVGGGMLTASVPCLIVGQVRRKSAKQIIETNCAQQPDANIRFTIQNSSNGLGLAMQF